MATMLFSADGATTLAGAGVGMLTGRLAVDTMPSARNTASSRETGSDIFQGEMILLRLCLLLRICYSMTFPAAIE
jgi:hypothetical protein